LKAGAPPPAPLELDEVLEVDAWPPAPVLVCEVPPLLQAAVVATRASERRAVLRAACVRIVGHHSTPRLPRLLNKSRSRRAQRALAAARRSSCKDFYDPHVLRCMTKVPLAFPCGADFASMNPAGARARLCEACDTVVHDLSSLTEKEAEALLGATSQRLCVRYLYDATGEVWFRDQLEAVSARQTIPARALVRSKRAARAVLSACAIALPVLTEACGGAAPRMDSPYPSTPPSASSSAAPTVSPSPSAAAELGGAPLNPVRKRPTNVARVTQIESTVVSSEDQAKLSDTRKKAHAAADATAGHARNIERSVAGCGTRDRATSDRAVTEAHQNEQAASTAAVQADSTHDPEKCEELMEQAMRANTRNALVDDTVQTCPR